MKTLFGLAVALALIALFVVVVLKTEDLNEFANLVREWIS